MQAGKMRQEHADVPSTALASSASSGIQGSPVSSGSSGKQCSPMRKREEHDTKSMPNLPSLGWKDFARYSD
eukprot:1156785-Pelagomonas_calceolata.AAC.3